MQVASFLDEYRRLCQTHNAHISQLLVSTLKMAIECGEEPEIIEMRGNTEDLRNKRIDDNYLKLIIMKPLSMVSFINALDLSLNELTDVGAEYLADYLKTNRSLKALSLVSNNITYQGCAFLSQALQFNQSLVVLQLNYNPLGDAGGMELANMLQVNSTLQELYVAGCNFGTRSLISLATVLQTNTSIETLDISDNKSTFSTLTQSMMSSFMTHLARTIRYSQTIRKLHLSKLAITDWIIVDHLASAIRDNTSLTHIDLSANRIGQDGGIHLANALKSNTNLLELCLSHCSIQEPGAKAMRDMLIQNNTLQRLFLNHNGISGKGLCYIAEGIRKNETLTVLYIWGNHFNEESSEELAKLVGGYQSETCIGSQSDRISEADMKQLKSVVSSKNYVRLIKESDIEAAKAKTGAKTASMTAPRLHKENLDVTFYRVEGVAYAAGA